MKREHKVLLAAVSLGALIAVGGTLPLWFDLGEAWGPLVLLSIPGAFVAFPLSLVGVGNPHDPSSAVIAVVDFIFYAWLFYWLMMRRLQRASQ